VLCCLSASSIAIGVACECARALRKMAQARLPYPNTIIPPFAARATPRGERRDYSIRVGEPCLSHFSHNCYEFSERSHLGVDPGSARGCSLAASRAANMKSLGNSKGWPTSGHLKSGLIAGLFALCAEPEQSQSRTRAKPVQKHSRIIA